MSKRLMINRAGFNRRLADSVDLAQLGRNVEDAMGDGAVLQLPVALSDAADTSVTLLLNCKAAAAVALVEI